MKFTRQITEYQHEQFMELFDEKAFKTGTSQANISFSKLFCRVLSPNP